MSKTPYYYASGKRKTAIARVKLVENGTGTVKVNDCALKDYFSPLHREVALAPLEMTGNKQSFDVSVTIVGGGPSSQAEALRHGICRALILFDPELRLTLKKAGFLRRDSRVRERKKPGLKRARRAPQWAKR